MHARALLWPFMLCVCLQATPARGDTAPAGTSGGCLPELAAPSHTPPDIRVNGTNLETALSSITVDERAALRIEFYPRRLDERLLVLPSRGRVRWHDESRATVHVSADAEQTPANAIELCTPTFYSRLLLWRSTPVHLTKSYPPPPARDPDAYAAPPGLIRVDGPEQAAIRVSEHFTLGQFLPEGSSWPRYTLLSMALLEKLELTVRTLSRSGVELNTLRILSAYRDPAHNARVGGATYSRHQYGDAVDFIVDANDDGQMDDLNQDGRIDREDLFWVTDRLQRSAIPVSLGGVGTYESGGPAQAFLHMDARGFPERWRQ